MEMPEWFKSQLRHAYATQDTHAIIHMNKEWNKFLRKERNFLLD
jgi:hypothetical protein